MTAPLTLVNPTDRDWSRHRYVLSFGAYAATHLLVWANGIEAALETAAAWLAEHAPGHIMPAWGEEHTSLVREACEERGLPYPPPDDADLQADGYYAAQQDAEADLTETESGYLTSYEWAITLEDPTRAELKAFIAALAERHYSDDPVVAVA